MLYAMRMVGLRRLPFILLHVVLLLPDIRVSNAGCTVEICSFEPWLAWTECPCGSGVQYRSRALCCDVQGGDVTWESCLLQCGLLHSDHEESRDCNSSYCENGGALQGDGYSCLCVEGYTGHCCQNEIDECETIPCKNGATCYDWVNAFSCECQEGFYGTQCETGVCQPSVADIVFLLDSSVSQTEDNFKRQLEFVNEFIDHVAIGENDQQIAVVTYSTEAKIQITLGQHVNKSELKQAVGNITFMPGATFTDRGLEAVVQVFAGSTSTRIYGNTARRYVIVLTDGLSYDRQKTEEAATALKTIVNKVLAVGIGIEVSHTELLTIASSDEQDRRKYVFSVQNFNALYTIVKQLVRLTCEECVWSTSADVVFLLDASPLMSGEEFQLSLDAVTYLTEKIMDLETENSTTTVALLTYSMGVHLHRRLNDSGTKDEFLFDLQKVALHEDYCAADNEECASSGLRAALNKVRQSVFDETPLKDNGTRGILVVLSNGKGEIGADTESEIRALSDEDKYVLVVAVGTSTNVTNLQLLTGDPALVFAVVEDSLTSLDALVEEFFFASCNLTNNFTDMN